MNKLNGIQTLLITNQNLKTVGSLGKGERLYTNGLSFGKYCPAVDTTEKTSSYYKQVCSFFSSVKQTVERKWHKQTTDDSISSVRKTILSAKETLIKLDSSDKEEKQAIAFQLVEMQISLQNEGFQNLEQTSLERANSIFGISKIKLENRKKEFSLLKKEKQDLLEVIKQKLDLIVDQPLSLQDEENLVRKTIFSLLEEVSQNVSTQETFSYLSVKNSFSSLFGLGLTSDLLNFYGMNKKTSFSLFDVQALLIGAASNLTKEDALFIAISKSWDTCGKKKLNEILSNIREKGINDQNLLLFLEEIRKVSKPSKDVIKELENRSTEKNPSMVSAVTFQDINFSLGQLKKDLGFLDACSLSKKYAALEKNSKVFVLGETNNQFEYLSRDIAYGLNVDGASYRSGTLFPLFENGKWGIQEAHPIIQKDGIFGTISYSATLNKNQDEEIPVNILFRGTDPSDRSLGRDLSLWEKQSIAFSEGPGGYSFTKNRALIQKTISDHLNKIHGLGKGKIRPRYFGHSLGSTDAQTAIALLSELLAQLGILGKSLPISEIELHAFNAPGVGSQINERFLEALKQLPEIKVLLHYYKTEHDPVQLAGGVYLGACDPKDKPDNLFTTVFKFVHGNLPTKDQYLLAHGGYCMMGEENLKNGTYLADVRTNDPKYVGLPLGSQGQVKSKVEPEIAALTLRQNVRRSF